MINLNNLDIVQITFAGLKIAIMIVVVMHVFFLAFILKQVTSMRRMLSSFNQIAIEVLGILYLILLFVFLIYVILLPQ